MRRLKRILALLAVLASVTTAAAVFFPGTLAMVMDQTSSFVNTFSPGDVTGDANTTIAIQKTVINTGKYSITADGFQFLLTDEATGQQHSATSDVNGNAAFQFAYTEENVGQTFTYTVQEVNNGQEGVTYDTTEYQVQITVDFEGDELVASCVVDGIPVDDCVLTFVNGYTHDEEPPPPPPTGDRAQPLLYLFAMVASAVLLTVLVIKRKQLH